MMYGYARCSTNETLQDINRQTRELIKQGVEEQNIYLEYESGTKVDRIQLNRLLDVVAEGDTIIATEVSRLSRSMTQVCDIIKIAEKKKLKLAIGTMLNVDFSDDNTQDLTVAGMKKGIFVMMGIYAEMERDMIRQRVKSGMANAKEKGVAIGRPTTAVDNLPQSFLKHYPMYISKQINQEGLARLCGVTRQSVNKYIKIYKQATT